MKNAINGVNIYTIKQCKQKKHGTIIWDDIYMKFMEYDLLSNEYKKKFNIQNLYFLFVVAVKIDKIKGK